METIRRWIACIVAGVVLNGLAFADVPNGANPRKDDLVRNILASWKARQSQVQTLTCSTEVDTFYPRGWMPDLEADPRVKAKWGDRKFPEEDTWFKEDSCFWAFDFVQERVRIESRLMGPWGGGDHQKFHPSHDLRLFKDGIFTRFHPGQTEQERHDPDTGALRVDAAVGRRGDSSLMFSSAELPLMWSAGGVSGRSPAPTELHYLEAPARFSYRGEVSLNQRRCVVLSVQEQQSTTAVREFWVDVEPPHPIRSCRIRDGDAPICQIDVEYRNRDGLDLPAKWTNRAYNYPLGQLFMARTYKVRDMKVNVPLADDLFTKAFDPGTIVRVPDANGDYGTFEVERDGSLVPLGSGSSRSHWFSIVLWSGIGLALAGVLVRSWWRRRHRTVSGPGPHLSPSS